MVYGKDPQIIPEEIKNRMLPEKVLSINRKHIFEIPNGDPSKFWTHEVVSAFMDRNRNNSNPLKHKFFLKMALQSQEAICEMRKMYYVK